MVSDMIITHHENAMKDRLSGKSHTVSMQMAPHMNTEQCNNLEGEMQQLTERTGSHRNQTKNITKEVCAHADYMYRYSFVNGVVYG
jgi:hypothetical protein